MSETFLFAVLGLAQVEHNITNAQELFGLMTDEQMKQAGTKQYTMYSFNGIWSIIN